MGKRTDDQLDGMTFAERVAAIDEWCAAVDDDLLMLMPRDVADAIEDRRVMLVGRHVGEIELIEQ